MTKTTGTILAFILTAFMAYPADLVAQDVAEVKEELDKALAKLESNHGEKVKSIVAQYPKALDNVEESLMQQGDLDGVLAVRKEKERIAKEQSIPPRPPVDLLQGIKDAQADCRRLIAAAEQEWHKSILVLTENYVKNLDKLVKQLTADNKLEDAIAANEELELSKSQIEDIGSRIAAADSGPKGTECPGCRGKSKIVKQCYYCEGTGRCSKCRGTGRVRKSGAKQQSSTVVHALCRGTGKCPRCKSEGQEEVVCRECKGTGIKP